MSPGSSTSEGFRESVKRRARRVQKWLQPEDQVSTSRTPSPQPHPSSGALLSPPLSTHEQLLQLPAQPQQPTSLPQAERSVGVSTSRDNLAAINASQSADAKSTPTQVAKKIGAEAWIGLKATLNLLERSSDAFPPLKSAVAGFLSVVDVFQTAAQNKNDYAELASNLKGIIDDFSQHPDEHTSSKMSDALKAMKGDLEKELERALEQPQHSGLRRHYEAGQGVVDVQECRRRVDALCRELQSKVLVEIWRNQKEQQADARLDKLNAALKAMYNSSLSDVVGRRRCTPGTREALLAEMRNWANNPDGPKVYWLNGMAGTGKTTLAYSFCAEMQLVGRLGASFFCSRADADSQDVSRIIPTIAYQLARFLPSYNEAIIRRMSEDKEIGVRNIETQFEKLIRDLLLEIKASMPKDVIVTIDALDECDRREGAQDILNALFLHTRDLPVKFFVTCRPEPGLFDTLQSAGEGYRTALHLHQIESLFVQADIRAYLQAELGAVSLSEEKLGRLAEQAGTLFIYAATAVRYIRPKGRQVNSHQRLDQLLSIASKIKTNKHKGIDDLYIAVLAAPFNDDYLDPGEKENIRLVLDTAVCAREPMGVTTMAKLLGLDGDEDVVHALQHLRSVLQVSQDTNLISTLHASFPDFMLDLGRSKDLGCAPAKHHLYLSLRCFSTMESLLRFNICDLTSSFDLDEGIPDLAKRLENAIPPELLYACRNWADHLVSVEAQNDICSVLEGFLSNRLLFWMEVLNLNRCINVGARGLFQVQAWAQRTGCPIDLQQLARDAAGFVTMFSSNTVSRSTPHIYISALPFWPEQRPVSKHYSQKMKGLPKATGTGMRRRESAALAVCVTPSGLCCVAHSSDGAYIAVGSSDNTIRIWDAYTGKMIGEPLEGHTNRVSSVACSPDDARIVSGSDDSTIRIWDAHTRKVIGEPLEGHTGAVSSVAFSFDGTRIISGSHDNTIRIWDAHSGKMIGEPLTGHTNEVNSIAYSSIDALVASGSDDNTIRVWDALTGKMLGEPLEGHTGAVMSVAFSPNNSRIVSGSTDNTIRIWDSRTGEMVGKPLEGHTGWVRSVAYSSDDAYIVSGSYDNTIRIWDARTGKMVGEPLEGHTSGVRSVAFSSDNERIVSGSGDNTIRIWDTHIGKKIDESLEGHADTVYSVAYSSDDALVVSGSADNTIRVWDAHTGRLVGGPFEGHTNVIRSVALSSNGARIISGSGDRTIRVWDVRSGEMIGEPLIGHTDEVNSVAYSSDDARIVSGSDDDTIRVWDALTGKMIGEPFEGHTSGVWSVEYSSDDTRIVSGSDDRTIRIWDAHTGLMIGEPLEGHTGAVMSVAYSSDGAHIVSGSDDNTIRIWDANTGKMIGEPLQGHTSRVWSVAFTSNNALVVSGSSDGTIRVWDAHTGKMIGEPFEGHTSGVRSVACSFNGARIISGSYDHTIRIWDMNTDQVIGEPLEGHSNAVSSLAYSSDGGRLLSDSSPNAAHITNLEPMTNDPHTHWVLDQDGYMRVDGSKLLMWVPSDVWNALMRPQNTAVISRQGSVQVDFTNARISDSWTRCYHST